MLLMGASASVPQHSIHEFTGKDGSGKGVDLSIYKGKVRVNGPTAAPVYKFLKASASGTFGSRIKWNFTKFLVDKEEHVTDRYSITIPPMAIEDDIKKALGID